MSKVKLTQSQLREKLNQMIDEAEWAWLKTHAQRDAVIVVAPSLSLLEVGEGVAEDSSQKVQAWIKKRLLAKPTAEQMKRWDENPALRFMSLVVQPYVLIQEVVMH